MQIEPGWIDHNGHLNMAYYPVLFDRCVDQAWRSLGLGEGYLQSRGMTTYSAEFHIRYLRELPPLSTVRVTYRLLAHDEKRVHSWQEILHPDGWVAATGENMHLSIDPSGPRVAAFPPDIQASLARMAADHAELPWPKDAGQGIAMQR